MDHASNQCIGRFNSKIHEGPWTKPLLWYLYLQKPLQKLVVVGDSTFQGGLRPPRLKAPAQTQHPR
eukprot:5690057-Pyramimonas_sp.AAC.2